MSKTKIIGIVVAVVVSAAGAWLLRSRGPALDFETFKFMDFVSGLGGGKDAADQSPDVRASADLPQTYTHPAYGFSFDYPKGFKTSSFNDENGETVLVQKEGSAAEGFQIYITPFDEPAFVETSAGKAAALTPERIKRDIPEMVIESPQTVLIGRKSQITNSKSQTPNQSSQSSDATGQANSGNQIPNSKPDDGVPALVFFSQDESARTREVWFVWPLEPAPDGNYLYQITAYAEFDEELSKIMATFAFDTD